jgi:hypothetical protein
MDVILLGATNAAAVEAVALQALHRHHDRLIHLVADDGAHLGAPPRVVRQQYAHEQSFTSLRP